MGSVLKPRDHQIKAVEFAKRHFKEFERGQLIHACGTGKTFTSLLIAKELEAKNILVLVPSLSLLKQTLSTWKTNFDFPITPLCVCSDNTVSCGIDESKIDLDELKDFNVDVTTEVNDIIKYLNNEHVIKLIFSTYQSSDIVHDAIKRSDITKLDLSIYDEAHRTATKNNGQFSNSLHIQAKKKLFMTATPKIFDSKLKLKLDDENESICSMDDPKIYGSVFSKLNFSDAISLGLLSDYKIKLIVTSKSTFTNDVINKNLKLSEEEFSKVWALTRCYKNRSHLISYHNTVKHAKDFAQNIIDFLPYETTKSIIDLGLRAYHVNGTLNTKKRDEIIKEYISTNKAIITNARCLIEGVDIPIIDGIFFAEPKKSMLEVVQATGRILRKLEDEEKLSNIIIPVYTDDTKNIDEILYGPNFKTVWDVFESMKDQDDRLKGIFDDLMILEGYKSISKLDKLQETNYQNLKKSLYAYFDSNTYISSSIATKKEFLEKLIMHSLNYLGDSWYYFYGQISGFISENDFFPGHYTFDDQEMKLARWCEKQRLLYKKNILTQQQKKLKLLMDIDFDFIMEEINADD